MTGESASKISTGDRGKCPGRRVVRGNAPIPRRDFGWRKLQAPGEPGTPHSPVPGSPGPPPASPGPRARSARHNRLEYRADPGTDGRRHTAAPIPRSRLPWAARNTTRHAERAPSHRRMPFPGRAGQTQPDANERFTEPANRRHAAGLNRSTGPDRSLVSRTRTRPP